ncbi:hypothetical protein [Mycolicibacterium porcinum]|uniref:DNA primase n=1 Tax=Mycolicibacterium porcinum TaxID=39693 RepID=A0AAW5TDG8_9MYCO|nr:hypothetical protein [Mycolicibacterium porcinum]MCV7391935.1 hypothetical protein [Mycolicibacterium porcinum]
MSPWAVLFGVLLRVSASVPHLVQLPGVIGGRASLNLLCAFVGRSGTGKGASAKVAALAWPVDVLVLPLGSGQGIAEAFTKRSDPVEVVPVIFDVPEIDTSTGLTKVQGSILLPTIKSMAMGEQLGQANATKGASRNVPAHSYRACMSVGAQPGHTGVLFSDTSGGTPQRFLWVSVTDPNITDGEFDDPEPLDADMPAWTPGADGVVEIVYAVPEIAAAIKAANTARNRGEVDALDGRALLTRCKVAALMAIMHGEIKVTSWEWHRAGEIMEVSDRTRASLQVEETEIQAAAIRERRKNDVLRWEGRENHRRAQTESVKTSVVNTLFKRCGQASASDLSTALGKSHRRKLLNEALAELVVEGVIVVIPVAGGKRYQLVEGVQGEQAVQGGSVQVGEDERAVQGERSASVVSLEEHRSEKRAGRKLSCRNWLDGHLSDLRVKGHEKVRGAAVREAGQAAGYNLNSLYVAANALGYKGEVWDLAG